MSNSNNKINVPEAKAALNKLKMEAASEVGVNLKDGYNGDLTSRQAGQIGGNMLIHMLENAENGKDYSGKCYISHSACFEDARTLADMVEQVFSKLSEPIRICEMGTVIGSHAGCGAVAIFFYGKERTDCE